MTSRTVPTGSPSRSAICFWAEEVQINTIRVGDFVGSVAMGGACNYQRVHLTPHGNGTHTECYGHISPDPEATLDKCLQEYLFFARLISLPVRAEVNGDQVIRVADVAKALVGKGKTEALVLRTLPNQAQKRTRDYSGRNPPYLEPEWASCWCRRA